MDKMHDNTTLNQTSNDSCHSEGSNKFWQVDADIANDTVVNLTYYILALLLGLPGNGIIIQAYAWKKRQTSTDVLIMAQAIVDITACTFTPVFIIKSGFPGLITVGLCRIAMIMEELPAHASLLLTAAISIDRYLIVCHPLRRRITRRKSILVVIVCAAIAIVINIFSAVLMETDVDIFNGRRTCTLSSSNSVPLVVLGGTFVALFFASFTIATLFYALVYAFLRKRAQIHADLVDNLPPAAAISSMNSYPEKEMAGCSSHDSSQSPTRDAACTSSVTDSSQGNKKPARIMEPDLPLASSSTAQSQPRVRLENQAKIAPKKPNKHDFGRKTTSMLLVITIFFFVTWIPKLVIPASISSVKNLNNHMKRFLAVLFMLRVTNHVVNFFVYYSINNRFRRDVHESFKKCKGNNFSLHGRL